MSCAESFALLQSFLILSLNCIKIEDTTGITVFSLASIWVDLGRGHNKTAEEKSVTFLFCHFGEPGILICPPKESSFIFSPPCSPADRCPAGFYKAAQTTQAYPVIARNSFCSGLKAPHTTAWKTRGSLS